MLDQGGRHTSLVEINSQRKTNYSFISYFYTFIGKALLEHSSLQGFVDCSTQKLIGRLENAQLRKMPAIQHPIPNLNILYFGSPEKSMCISGDTLLRDNRRLIGRSIIVLARQVQNNRD